MENTPDVQTGVKPKVVDGPLKSAWKRFGLVIGDPWNLILLTAIVALLLYAAKSKEPGVVALLQILVSLVSAVLGGRIVRYVDSLVEGSVLVARGRTAVRSLKLLLRSVSSLEERVQTFLIAADEAPGSGVVTKRNYEEIIASCRLVQEETVSSIENWTDIVAEADIESLIGVITSLRQQVDKTGSELSELHEHFGRVAELTSEQTQAIVAKENELMNVKAQLAAANSRLVFSGGGPLADRSKLGDLINSYSAIPTMQVRRYHRASDNVLTPRPEPVDSDDTKK